MINHVVTFIRADASRPWPQEQPSLTAIIDLVRQKRAAAPGFVSVAYEEAEDKLTLTRTEVWESQELCDAYYTELYTDPQIYTIEAYVHSIQN